MIFAGKYIFKEQNKSRIRFYFCIVVDYHKNILENAYEVRKETDKKSMADRPPQKKVWLKLSNFFSKT